MFAEYGINTDYVMIGLAAVQLVLLIIIVLLCLQVHKLRYSYKLFMSDKDGRSLENALSRRVDEIDTLMVEHEIIKSTVDKIDKRTANSFKKVGICKYDAFEEGGKLSYTICLLDDHEDGFIINAIHGSDGCYTYMKEIINGNSYTKLSFEEQEALDKAKVGMEE